MDFDSFLEWEKSTKDSLDVKKIYIDIADDLVAGIVLSQIIYYYLPDRSKKRDKLRVFKHGNYWLAKGRNEWYDEVRITVTQLDRALRILYNKGIIDKQVMKFNGNPTVHVRLIVDRFLELLSERVEVFNLLKHKKELDIIDALKKGYDKKAYHDYLETDMWKQKRELVLNRDNHKCTKCSSKKSLQCHHLTYKNLGDEPLDDLVTLCLECHNNLHGIEVI